MHAGPPGSVEEHTLSTQPHSAQGAGCSTHEELQSLRAALKERDMQLEQLTAHEAAHQQASSPRRMQNEAALATSSLTDTVPEHSHKEAGSQRIAELEAQLAAAQVRITDAEERAACCAASDHSAAATVPPDNIAQLRAQLSSAQTDASQVPGLQQELDRLRQKASQVDELRQQLTALHWQGQACGPAQPSRTHAQQAPVQHNDGGEHGTGDVAGTGTDAQHIQSTASGSAQRIQELVTELQAERMKVTQAAVDVESIRQASKQDMGRMTEKVEDAEVGTRPLQVPLCLVA